MKALRASMSSRSSTSVEDRTEQLTRRLAALGRAHDLVRLLPHGHGQAALMGDLFTVATRAIRQHRRVLGPHLGRRAANGRRRKCRDRSRTGDP
jgi:hypothetical protein